MALDLSKFPLLIPSSWTTFKSNTITGSKTLPPQYDDDGTVYTIFAIDGTDICYTCTIWKGTVPDGVINTGYSQSQNDTDKSDFETNYKTNANQTTSIVWTGERAVADGIIPNGVSGVIGGYIGTSATSLVAVRATSYTEQSTAAQRSVSSSSASDASAGTGTRTLKITYYDASMNGPFTETITMNGTSAVNTTNTNICFIEKMETITIGTNGGNVGTITLFVGTGGAGGTIGTIAAGDGKTYWAHHYVRSGRTMFMRRLYASTAASGTSANVSIRSIPIPTANQFETQYGTQFRAINAVQPPALDFDALLAVAGPARCTIYVKPDAVTASTFFINFTFYEI